MGTLEIVVLCVMTCTLAVQCTRQIRRDDDIVILKTEPTTPVCLHGMPVENDYTKYDTFMPSCDGTTGYSAVASTKSSGIYDDDDDDDAWDPLPCIFEMPYDEAIKSCHDEQIISEYFHNISEMCTSISTTASNSITSTTSTTSSTDSITTDEQGYGTNTIETCRRGKSRKGELSKVPIRLAGHAVNAISLRLGEKQIQVCNNSLPILNTLIHRFDSLLRHIISADRQTTLADGSMHFEPTTMHGLLIDTDSITRSLQRIHKFRHTAAFKGKKGDSLRLYQVVCADGDDRAVKAPTKPACECIKEAVAVVAKHALILFADIPYIHFDDHDEIVINGEHFPTHQDIVASVIVGVKRKHYDDDDDDMRAMKKKRPCHESTKTNTRYKANVSTLCELHNQVSGLMGGPRLQGGSVSAGRCFEEIEDDLVQLIYTAVSADGLHIHPIHQTYPVTVEYFRWVGQRLGEYRRPTTRQGQSLLEVLGRADEEDEESVVDAVDVMHSLARWYAVIALAVFPSIPGVWFVDGELHVRGRPLLRSCHTE